MLLHVSFLLIKLEYGKSKGEILNFTNTRQQFDTRTMKMDTQISSKTLKHILLMEGFLKKLGVTCMNSYISHRRRGLLHCMRREERVATLHCMLTVKL